MMNLRQWIDSFLEKRGDYVLSIGWHWFGWRDEALLPGGEGFYLHTTLGRIVVFNTDKGSFITWQNGPEILSLDAPDRIIYGPAFSWVDGSSVWPEFVGAVVEGLEAKLTEMKNLNKQEDE